MKKIRLIATISLFVLAAVIICSSTIAQKPGMKTFMYYVNVHLSAQQLNGVQYRIEIWDQFGSRVLAPQTSRPGEHIYVFQETVPSSVTGFVRIARVIFLPNRSGDSPSLWANPDAKSVLNPGNYFFNLYPVIIEKISSAERNQKE